MSRAAAGSAGGPTGASGVESANASVVGGGGGGGGGQGVAPLKALALKAIVEQPARALTARAVERADTILPVSFLRGCGGRLGGRGVVGSDGWSDRSIDPPHIPAGHTYARHHTRARQNRSTQRDKEGRQYVKQGVIDALAKDNRLLDGTLPLAFFEPDQRRLSFRGASKARGTWGLGWILCVWAALD